MFEIKIYVPAALGTNTGASADTDDGVEGLKAGELTRSFGLLCEGKETNQE